MNKTMVKALTIGVILVVLVISGCVNFKKVEDPVFSPAEGIYPPVQYVQITSPTNGASVYFTLDGSVPDESSYAYTGAIPVSSDTTIRAIAIKNGLLNSNVVQVVYDIQSSPNNPPFISILSPANESAFSVGDVITIVTAALDGDGFVSSVEFLVDGVSVYVDNQGPGFEYSWINVPAGNFYIQAIARDDDGAMSAAGINVIVS